MIVPCERSGDFFGLDSDYLIGDGILLNYFDSVAEHTVLVFDRYVFDIDGVFGAVYKAFVIEIDGIVLHV